MAERLGTDEHVTSLGNLQLVSVLTEKCAISVECVDGLSEVGSIREGWRSWAVGTVVLMTWIVVIIVVVQLVVSVGARLGLRTRARRTVVLCCC